MPNLEEFLKKPFKKKEGVIKRRFYRSRGPLEGNSLARADPNYYEEVPEEEANLVGSMTARHKNFHAPAIDIDLPCRLYESRTPGHFHLLIEKEVTWTKYKKLLLALEDCGIIEKGYYEASLARGQTFLRTETHY